MHVRFIICSLDTRVLAEKYFQQWYEKKKIEAKGYKKKEAVKYEVLLR